MVSGILNELLYFVSDRLMLVEGSETSIDFWIGPECSFDYELLIVTVLKGSFSAIS